MQNVIDGEHLTADTEVVVNPWNGETMVRATVLSVTSQHNHLGGQWSLVDLRVGDEVTRGVDSRLHIFYTPDRPVFAWCPDCRSTREVLDDHDEAVHTRDGEQHYRVRNLSCEHTLEDRGALGLPSPGAPYAGPQTVTARTPSLRDRLAAATRAARRDARH